MSSMNIYLFGEIRLVPGNRSNPVHMTHSVQRLLAYLVLQRYRSHSREVLAGLFWGDQSQQRARNCLNTTLWRLRQALEPYETKPNSYLINTSSGEIGFNENSDYWLDMAHFESQSEAILQKPFQSMGETDANHLIEVLHLYQSDLLQSIYDDWALRERERIRSLRQMILTHLMQYYYHHKEYQSSLEYGRQILADEPLREEIYRLMMMNYLALGERSSAIQQYHTCKELLAKELSISPMEETQLLYLNIREESSLAGTSYSPDIRPSPYKPLLDQAQYTLDSLNETHRQLQHLLRLIEQISSEKQNPEHFG